jgi:hypothetical protein
MGRAFLRHRGLNLRRASMPFGQVVSRKEAKYAISPSISR